MNAERIVKAMIDKEVSGRLQPDELIVIRDARMRLQATLQTGHGVGRAKEDAREIMKAWGHELPTRSA